MNNKLFLAVLGVLAIGGAVTGVMMSGGNSDLSNIETAAGESTGAADPSLSIAVVDVQQLLKESAPAKSLEGEVKKLRESFGAELQAEENRLREAEKALVDERKKGLSDADFKTKRTAFEKDVRDSQKKMQDKREGLEKQITASVDKLREEILKIVAELSTANKYDLVLSRADIVLVSKHIDVTGDVMSKLNDAMPSLALGDAPAQAEEVATAPVIETPAVAAAAPAATQVPTTTTEAAKPAEQVPAAEAATATTPAAPAVTVPAVTPPQATEPAAGSDTATPSAM